MLDRPTTASDTFVLSVHSRVPADWPGIKDRGDARVHLFQTREFLEVWARTYAARRGIELCFVDVTDRAGRMLMRVPLAIETRGGLRLLSFADQGCGDYNAPVLYPAPFAWTAELATSLWAAIEAALPRVDKIVLEKMPAMVRDCANPLHWLSAEANPESCHGSVLTRPWAEIEKTQAQLSTLKRKARGLEKLGTVRFFVAETAEERARVLTRLLEQKQRRYEDTKVPGFAEQPDQKRFFELATDVFGATGNLHLAALEVGGEIVATSWTVSVGDVVYETMIGFEAGEWAKHSPGRVLNLRFLEWAKEAGFSYLDHGVGDEDWKIENCDTHVPLGRMIAARSAKGRFEMRRHALVQRVKSSALYERLRPYKWIVKRAIAARLGRAA